MDEGISRFFVLMWGVLLNLDEVNEHVFLGSIILQVWRLISLQWLVVTIIIVVEEQLRLTGGDSGHHKFILLEAVELVLEFFQFLLW